MKTLALRTILLSTLTITWLSSSGVAKRFPSDVSDQNRKKIVEIEALLGADPHTGVIATSYSKKNLSKLLTLVEDGNLDVKGRAIELLAEYLKQANVPKNAVRGQIMPNLQKLLGSNQDKKDAGSVAITQHLRRAIWQAEWVLVEGLSKKKFLKDSIRRKTGRPYYIYFEAMDNLAELDDPIATEILQARLDEEGPDDRDPRIVARIKECLSKAGVLKSLKGHNSKRQIAMLRDEVKTATKGSKRVSPGMMVWIVRKLAELGGEDGQQALREIRDDSALPSRVRKEAEEALIRAGGLKPKERKIYSD